MNKQDVLTIPTELDSTRSKSKTKFIVGGLLLMMAIGYLIFTGIQSSATYFLTISELNEQHATLGDRQVRVSGMVDETTINYNNTDLDLRFEIMAEDGSRMEVFFNGPKPDQMREGAEAIVEGTFDGQTFTAQTLLLKCPSRYDDGTMEEVELQATS